MWMVFKKKYFLHAALCALTLGQQRATGNSCEDCLAMNLTNGVFPPGVSTSVEALSIIPDPIGRNDAEFLK